jgi:hypothetical protein
MRIHKNVVVLSITPNTAARTPKNIIAARGAAGEIATSAVINWVTTPDILTFARVSLTVSRLTTEDQKLHFMFIKAKYGNTKRL